MRAGRMFNFSLSQDGRGLVFRVYGLGCRVYGCILGARRETRG